PGEKSHDATEDGPLVARDAYSIAYSGLNGEKRSLMNGKGGESIAFAQNVGQGEAIVLRAPPALFGSSKARTDKLRALYTAICGRHNLPLEANRCHHLRRGDYHIVYSYTDVVIEGRYIDVLSPGLEVVTNPGIPAGKPYLLLDIG